MNCHTTGHELPASVWSLGALDVGALAVLLAGSFLASTHCLMMCGPMLGLIRRHRRGIVWYNAARIFSYTLAGAVLAWWGRSLREAFPLTLQVLPGLILIGFVVTRLVRYGKRDSPCGSCVQNEKARPLLLGLIAVFTPCLSLTPALMLASQQGSTGRGALFMLIFGLGTIPVMAGGGALFFQAIQMLPRPLARMVTPLCCVGVLVMAAGWILR